MQLYHFTVLANDLARLVGAEADADDPAVKAQVELLASRCDELGIRPVTSLIWDVEEGVYDPDADAGGDGKRSTTGPLSPGIKVEEEPDKHDDFESDGTDEGEFDGDSGAWELDWDAKEDEAFREKWREERKREEDLERAIACLSMLQRYFPDRERYEAWIEAAKQDFRERTAQGE
ncbi:hypothetical protein JCM8097_003152 [Rhodosporidiobolus ruineniae]